MSNAVADARAALVVAIEALLAAAETPSGQVAEDSGSAVEHAWWVVETKIGFFENSADEAGYASGKQAGIIEEGER